MPHPNLETNKNQDPFPKLLSALISFLPGTLLVLFLFLNHSSQDIYADSELIETWKNYRDWYYQLICNNNDSPLAYPSCLAKVKKLSFNNCYPVWL